MAYDIGPRIGIDGEADFRKSIQEINANIKTLGSEMKLVTATYEDNADSMEALSAKSDVLERSLEQQEKHLAEVSKMLEAAKSKYSENSTEVQKWQRAVNESKTALQRTNNELEEMRREIDKLDDDTEDAADAFEELGEGAEKVGDKLSTMKVATGNLIADGVGILVDGVRDAASWMINLDDATEDYRVSQGKLKAAYTTTGKSAETASTAYREMYRILGDTDQATEAAQLMADLAENEEDVGKWADIAAGTVAKFGDALPVENLIETAQEAVKTGDAVSGGLADALMWSGVNVDEFNEKLAACTTQEERNKLVTETLTGLMGPYADSFYETNDAVLAARDSQILLDEATGRLGEAVGKVKDGLIEEFGPTLADAADWAADFIEGIDTEELKRKFDDAWTFISEGAATVKGWLEKVGDAASGVLQDWGFGSRDGGFGTGQSGAFGGMTSEDIANAVESGVKGGFSGAAVMFDTGKTAGQITTAQKNNDRARGGSSGSW